MMWYVAAALIAGGAMQNVVAVAGYALALRGPYYDAIASSTLFDGRWVAGSLALSIGLTLAWHWPWWRSSAFSSGDTSSFFP